MISKGDRVRAHFFRRRFNRRLGTYENDLICTRIGVVEFLHRDQAMVRFDGDLKSQMVPTSSLQKIERHREVSNG